MSGQSGDIARLYATHKSLILVSTCGKSNSIADLLVTAVMQKIFIRAGPNQSTYIKFIKLF